MGTIASIQNNTQGPLVFTSEWPEHDRILKPYSNVYFEWQPWVPWATNRADFDDDHHMTFDLGGIPHNIWYLYERWGDLRLFSQGYESGFSPPGFPKKAHDRMRVSVGPRRYQNALNPRLNSLYEIIMDKPRKAR